MKRFLILLTTLCCGFVYADTINLHWRNYDGTTYEDSTCVIDSDLIIPSTAPTRYGYTFTGWKFASYRPIEYLESTGTQWIDTGVIGTNNTKIELKYQFTSMVDVHKNRVYGSGASASSGALYYGVYNNKPITAYNSEITSDFSVDLLEHELIQNKNRFILDGTIINTHPVTTFNTPNNIRLFGLYVQNIMYYGHVKIFYIKIYNNDDIVRNFIPVLDKDGTPCMYDEVTQQFFYNQGTGNFIAGPTL